MKFALDTNAIVAALNGVPTVTTKLASLESARGCGSGSTRLRVVPSRDALG